MKMSVDENLINKNESTKVQPRTPKVRSFYNNNFPTDQYSYNLRIPFVGLILSIVFVQTMVALIDDFSRTPLIAYGYIFAAAGVGYELYYGLKIGDRKQYTPWIILKIIENCLMGVFFFYFAVRGVVGIFFCILIFTVPNIWVTYIVISRSIAEKIAPPTKPNTIENNYESYDKPLKSVSENFSEYIYG